MARKVPNDVQKVFDKYTTNFVRKLKKDVALEMFKKEFQLDERRGEIMFEMFDKDQNDVLSSWEFYLFYQTFGYDANAYLDKFAELCKEANSDECADVSKTWDFLKSLKTLSGRNFDDEELHTTIRKLIGEEEKEKKIDQKKFMELICRIRLTRH